MPLMMAHVPGAPPMKVQAQVSNWCPGTSSGNVLSRGLGVGQRRWLRAGGLLLQISILSAGSVCGQDRTSAWGRNAQTRILTGCTLMSTNELLKYCYCYCYYYDYDYY